MKARALWSSLAWLALAAPAWSASAKVEAEPAESLRLGPQFGVSAAPRLSLPLMSPLAAPGAGQSFSLSAPVPLPAAPSVLPVAPVVEPTAPLAPAAPAEVSPDAREKGDEASSAESRAAFDGSGAGLAGLPEGLGLPDAVPPWPGAAGDRVRIAGRTYELGEKLGEGTSAVVYRVKGRPLVVKLIYPGLKEVEVFGGEREALAEMARTPIAHAALRAASADGMSLVKDLVQGEELWRICEKGPLSREQKDSLLDLAFQLVSLGRTADLNFGNLIWQEDSQRWLLIDAGGFAPAGPWAPLGQMLSAERRAKTGIDAIDFLAALRGRLGQDSPAWRETAKGGNFAYQKTLLEELRLRDAAAPR